MTDKTWEEYKKKKAEQLKNNTQSSKPVKAFKRATPVQLINKQNHVSDEIADSRMQLCEQCPELIKMTKQCKKCGCFMALKTKLKLASCPMGKW